LPYPRDTPTIIARHRTAGTSQQDDLGTAVQALPTSPPRYDITLMTPTDRSS